MRKAMLIAAFTLSVVGSVSLARASNEMRLGGEAARVVLTDDCNQRYCYSGLEWVSFWDQWLPGDIVGVLFDMGEPSMYVSASCDSVLCYYLYRIWVYDWNPEGPGAPDPHTVEFHVYCADETGCPIGTALWSSGPVNTVHRWNYISIAPPLDISPCARVPGPPVASSRILITATHVGSAASPPRWLGDEIQINVENGVEMIDSGGLPALYPRPSVSYYSTMHSGYYGNGAFQHCPPIWFADDEPYGYLELQWDIDLYCASSGVVSPDSSDTWGAIKSIYK